MESKHQVNQKALDFIAKSPKLLLIDGQWLPAQSGKTYDTINPATEEFLASVAEPDKADVDLAVSAARRAYEDSAWSAINPMEREALLNKIAALVA